MKKRAMLITLTCVALALCCAAAAAAPITHGPTVFTISSYGWTQNHQFPPGILLGQKTEAGRTTTSDYVEQKVVLGPSARGVAEANAIIRNDGRIFGAAAATPLNFPQPLSAFIGGGAQVQVRNSFRKTPTTTS